MTVDVLIPVYKRTGGLRDCSDVKKADGAAEPDHHYEYRKSLLERGRIPGYSGHEVHHLTKEEFDHGGTRNLAAWYSESDIMIF